MEQEKVKIQIKNRLGQVLCEYEKEENTVKDTVVEAVKNGADLRGADLRGADLRGAYLRGADLRDAYLCDADLGDADLRGADLRDAYLDDADIHGADLRGADLGGADLGDAKNVPYIPMTCPSDGTFTGWKKVKNQLSTYLVKLVITEDCKRRSATGRKCRCDKAVVSAVYDMGNNMSEVKRCVNYAYNHETEYIVGQQVTADKWDDNRWNECSHGIHFFINKQEAIDYNV